MTSRFWVETQSLLGGGQATIIPYCNQDIRGALHLDVYEVCHPGNFCSRSCFLPHMEAMAIPFHMRYGSMICSKRLQSDRPKSWGMLVEAGATEAKKTVNKQQYWSDVKTGVASAFLSVTRLFLRAGQTIIPHLKEGIQGYLLIIFFEFF